MEARKVDRVTRTAGAVPLKRSKSCEERKGDEVHISRRMSGALREITNTQTGADASVRSEGVAKLKDRVSKHMLGLMEVDGFEVNGQGLREPLIVPGHEGVGKKLGESGKVVVLKGWNNRTKIACKEYRVETAHTREKLAQEHAVLGRIHERRSEGHQYVVASERIYATQGGRHLLLLEKGKLDLFDAMEKRPDISSDESVRVRWCLEVMKGIKACHAAGVYPTDLKPENVLLFKQPDGSYTAKVTDLEGAYSFIEYGGIRVLSGGEMMRTLGYTAPEHFYAVQTEASLKGIAIFQLGVILLEILKGKSLISGLMNMISKKEDPLDIRHNKLALYLTNPRGYQEVFGRIVSGVFKEAGNPESLDALICQMIRPRHAERISLDGAIELLEGYKTRLDASAPLGGGAEIAR